MSEIQWTRVNNDSNGNPRYVCHFLALCTQAEKDSPHPCSYEVALKRAKRIGGKRFHNKQYGGGIVFVSYNLAETERHIKEVIAEDEPKEANK
jgi:hypothetical protein